MRSARAGSSAPFDFRHLRSERIFTLRDK